MIFKNKNILIISPQKWGDMKLSKHHYAEELAKKNKVYFLNPPENGFFRVEINRLEEVENIQVINFFDWKLRSMKNRINIVYDIGFEFLFKKIIKSINTRIDIVINFDNGVFFRYTNSSVNYFHIFFPVDKIVDRKIKEDKADMAFSISQNILDEIKMPLAKKNLLNHGLSANFLNNSQNLLYKGFQSKDNHTTLNVAYVGNILVASLDRKMLLKIIKENIECHFHLFGNISHSYRINATRGNLSTEDSKFIEVLMNLNNVTLYGAVIPEKLIPQLNEMDIFLLLYKPSKGYVMDNSHKLIEYLSFGKPIVSSYLSCYRDSNLFLMSDKKDAKTPYKLFKEVKNNYSKYHTKENFVRRIKFAIENSYLNHLKTISKIINQEKYKK